MAFVLVTYSLAVVWANRVKYLGCYFLSPSGDVDLLESIGKFLSFNNILNVQLDTTGMKY